MSENQIKKGNFTTSLFRKVKNFKCLKNCIYLFSLVQNLLSFVQKSLNFWYKTRKSLQNLEFSPAFTQSKPHFLKTIELSMSLSEIFEKHWVELSLSHSMIFGLTQTSLSLSMSHSNMLGIKLQCDLWSLLLSKAKCRIRGSTLGLCTLNKPRIYSNF